MITASDNYYIVMKKDFRGNYIFSHAKLNVGVFCDVESGNVYMPMCLVPTPGKFLDEPDIWDVFGPYKKSKRIFIEYPRGPNLSFEDRLTLAHFTEVEIENAKMAKSFFEHDGEHGKYCLEMSLEDSYLKRVTKANYYMVTKAAQTITVPARTPVPTAPQPPMETGTTLPSPQRPAKPPLTSQLATVYSNEPGPNGEELTHAEKMRRAERRLIILHRHRLI